MNKILIVTWIPSDDHIANCKLGIAKNAKIGLMRLEGKTKYFDFQITNKITTHRRWRDQESVDEYIKFLYELETRYGGTIVKIEVKDVD